MATQAFAANEEFQAFLDAHLERDLLRFSTAGSVDDGKSTLIGRLLHDTKSVYEDQLLAVQNAKVNRAGGKRMDLSLLTDGLRAEREQGITIDVAYRYFATSKRKFIIADTPGHEQYTRNMATGASTADVAIVLIDGSKGLLPQSRRHTFIASLLAIPHVVAAVNKMDLVNYSEERYREIEAEFVALGMHLGLRNIQTIPVSALEGDNVVEHLDNMPWYEGPTLLEYLENVPLYEHESDAPLRFPVQLVQRPDRTFRGFSGTVASGSVKAGQKVMALPSGKTTQVKRIVTWDGDLKEAHSGEAVTLELADEIDISRGEMIVCADARPHALPATSTHFSAQVVWMHEEPLVPGRQYLVKHTTRTVRATAKKIAYRVDVNTLHRADADKLALNEIGEIEFSTTLPLFFDPYRERRATGALILIDPISNATVGAAMITQALKEEAAEQESAPRFAYLPGEHAVAQQLLNELQNSGANAVLLDDAYISTEALPAAARAVQLAGAVAITSRELHESSLADIRIFSRVTRLKSNQSLSAMIALLNADAKENA
ncbi:MAG: sulfate adenylyltransferase subunit CysN [Acidobacteria bacterium]|nr:sulfate adenylyltransferase subunit CysN [Acidobacteriota bacterium]